MAVNGSMPHNSNPDLFPKEDLVQTIVTCENSKGVYPTRDCA